MIGQLRGLIVSKQPPELMMEVNNVGYELQASMNTFYNLPEIGQEVLLYTHVVIREDSHTLYGFHEKRERSLFRSLIKVNGVGPKMALAILSSMDPDGFVSCITNSDITNLTRIPGVGKKTAERLTIEMRDRLNDWCKEPSGLLENKKEIVFACNNVTQDAISALIALGYKPQEASRIVSKVSEEGLTSEELIRKALQN